MSPQVQIVYKNHRHQAIIIITTISNCKASCRAIPELQFQIQQPYWVRLDSCLQIQASKGSLVYVKLPQKQRKSPNPNPRAVRERRGGGWEEEGPLQFAHGFGYFTHMGLDFFTLN